MPKLKPNKSVSSRCKVTGTCKVRFNKAGKRHLNSHMSGNEIRAKRGTTIASQPDIPKLEQMLGGVRLKGVNKH